MFKTGLEEVEYKLRMLSGGHSFENKNSTSTEKNRKYKTYSFVKYIINKYTNLKKNDIKEYYLGWGRGRVGDKSRHHRPIGRLKTYSIYVYIAPGSVMPD